MTWISAAGLPVMSYSGIEVIILKAHLRPLYLYVMDGSEVTASVQKTGTLINPEASKAKSAKEETKGFLQNFFFFYFLKCKFCHATKRLYYSFSGSVAKEEDTNIVIIDEFKLF